MASDAPLPTRMRYAAVLMESACALLGDDARMGSPDHLRDELGLLVARLRKDEHWLNTEADHLETEAARDA